MVSDDDLSKEEHSHFGIRCKHRQRQRTCIVEYPALALDQFGARIVASEERAKDAVSRILSPLA